MNRCNLYRIDKARSRGAVLAVSLMTLLVLTVLALGASQATRTRQRAAMAIAEADAIFQAAEAGLRAGERAIAALPPYSIGECETSRCDAHSAGSLDLELISRQSQWWAQWGRAVAFGPTSPAARSPSLPEASYVIEHRADIPDSLTISPNGPPTGRAYYRVVSASGIESTAPKVVLQSTYGTNLN